MLHLQAQKYVAGRELAKHLLHWSVCTWWAGSGRRTFGSSPWWGSCAWSWGNVQEWGSRWNTSSPWMCWWWRSGRCWPCLALDSPARTARRWEHNHCDVMVWPTLNLHRPPMSSLLLKQTGSSPSSRQHLIQARPELPPPTIATRRVILQLCEVTDHWPDHWHT